jgi:hypothetical protein
MEAHGPIERNGVGQHQMCEPVGRGLSGQIADRWCGSQQGEV